MANYKVKPLKRAFKKKATMAKMPMKKMIKAIVKEEQQKEIESKQAFVSITSTDFNAPISGAVDTLRLIPNISNGTGDHQRIGDKIEPQRLNIRLILQMLPQGINQGDNVRKIACRVMVLTPKSYPNWATASTATAWQANLLKKGGAVTAFTGAIDDLYAPINSDAITCHFNKVFFFNQGSFYFSGATPTNTPVPFEQSNLTKFVNINLKIKSKTFKYDANIDSALTPTNVGYIMCMGYVFTDGTAPDASTRMRYQYISTLNYEDA